MARSVSTALSHIHAIMEPQVLILDNSGQEDEYFSDTVRQKARDLKIPVISLPDNALENMMWLTRLDSGSLSGKS